MLHTGIILAVIATSYCEPGQTAIGTPTSDGVLSVDPTVIPLRSRVRLIIRDAKDRIGHVMHIHSKRKFFRAEDTGDAIRGARIDLWMPSCANAVAWGRRLVQIELTPATKFVTQVITVRQHTAYAVRKF